MFDRDFEDMFADVWFGDKDQALASEEGIGSFDFGMNTFHSLDAIIIIKKYDRALKSKHYAVKRNRLRAQRNSIVAAFGPEMVDRVGLAS